MLVLWLLPLFSLGARTHRGVQKGILPAPPKALAASLEDGDGSTWRTVFQTLAHSEDFRFDIWGRRPFYATRAVPEQPPLLNYERVINGVGLHYNQDCFFATPPGAKTFLRHESGRDKVGRPFSAREINSNLAQGMTLTLNKAAAHFGEVSGLLIDASESFKLPCTANMYLTKHGVDLAMPPPQRRAGRAHHSTSRI